uniref:Aminopeptidase n=1 Tax=Macrostomum lignano TaxID=282301 RepID=A0A1I8IA71_9PLAT
HCNSSRPNSNASRVSWYFLWNTPTAVEHNAVPNRFRSKVNGLTTRNSTEGSSAVALFANSAIGGSIVLVAVFVLIVLFAQSATEKTQNKMGGYARYVPSSDGNNVVHLDGANAAGTESLHENHQQQQAQPPIKRGFYVSFPVVLIISILLVCAILAAILATFFAATGVTCSGGAGVGLPNSNDSSVGVTDSASSRSSKAGDTNGEDLRLPTDVLPLHYELTLAPYIYDDNESAFYFSGSVNITIHAMNATSVIHLHADRIALSRETVRIVTVEDNAVLPLTDIEYSLPSQWYLLKLASPVQPGKQYRIEILDFRKPLLLDLRGLYLSVYTQDGRKHYLVASQLQPTDARKTFPCFDEPAFKARFDVRLVHRRDFLAISNMQQQSFEYKQDRDSRGRLYRTWARPELVGIADYALTAVKNITQFFEGYFEVPFPLNKTDQAAIPDFIAGGMENWGLITYRESRLLFDPKKDTTSSLQNIGNVISHEVAHMWFGNLVTPQWWDDIWLNEGFATFTQILGVRQLHPDWDIDAQFVVETQMVAFYSDSKGSSHPIYMEVQNPGQITEIFDTITYRKGAAVLRMLYSFVGDRVFRRAIGNYLKQNSYSSTFHTSLYDSLTREAQADGRTGLDVAEVMDRWIKQMGHPVLTCSREAGSIRLEQSHFLSDPSQKPDPKFVSEYNYTWIIPVTMVTQSNASAAAGLEDVSSLVQWMRIKSQAFPAGSLTPGEWYLLNLRSAGFYRVNYDRQNWRVIIAQLMADHTVFTPQDRARLLDDSFSLAAAGLVDYSVPLNMTRYLLKESHYVPWRAAMSKLSLLHSMLHRSSAVYGPFSAHMRRLLAPAYADLGIETARGDSHLRRLRRALISTFACQYGVSACRRDALRLFEQFASKNYSVHLPPDVRRAVLCEGVASSTSAEHWDVLYQRSQIEVHPGLHNDILRALACTHQPWLLNRYLDYALDKSKIRSQDAASVFSVVSANSNGLQIVWDYMRNNWDVIVERVPNSFATAYFVYLLGEFNTPIRLMEMEEFRAKNQDKLTAVQRTMEQSLESVRINIHWMNSNLHVKLMSRLVGLIGLLPPLLLLCSCSGAWTAEPATLDSIVDHVLGCRTKCYWLVIEALDRAPLGHPNQLRESSDPGVLDKNAKTNRGKVNVYGSGSNSAHKSFSSRWYELGQLNTSGARRREADAVEAISRHPVFQETASPSRLRISDGPVSQSQDLAPIALPRSGLR